MIIVCEKCNTKNKLPDSLGSEEFANAKCGKCGFFFAKKPEEKFENNAVNTQNVRSSKIADDFILCHVYWHRFLCSWFNLLFFCFKC